MKSQGPLDTKFRTFDEGVSLLIDHMILHGVVHYKKCIFASITAPIEFHVVYFTKTF